MKKLDSKHRYDFASRFVFFACGIGAALVFWAIDAAALIAGGGSWPLIKFSDSSLFFLNSVSWYLYIYLLIAVPVIPFIIFLHIRTHTIFMITTYVFIVLVVFFAQRALFLCAIIYPILTFFAYRFDRRRSAALRLRL